MLTIPSLVEPIAYVTLIAIVSIVLALLLRRLMDRSTASRLSRSAARAGDAARLEVSSYSPSGGFGRIGTVSMIAPEAGAFLFRCVVQDASRSVGLRLLKFLMPARRATGDDAFDRDIYVSRPGKAGTLFATERRRAAVRRILRAGFIAVEYRNGLVTALHHGIVPQELAMAIELDLAVLASPPGEAAPAESASARAPSPEPMQPTGKPAIPMHLMLLDTAGCVLLGLGLASEFGGIDVLPVHLRFPGHGITFIVLGLLLIVPMLVRAVLRSRGQARPGQRPWP